MEGGDFIFVQLFGPTVCKLVTYEDNKNTVVPLLQHFESVEAGQVLPAHVR